MSLEDAARTVVLNGESVKDAKELAATWPKHVIEHQFAAQETVSLSCCAENIYPYFLRGKLFLIQPIVLNFERQPFQFVSPIVLALAQARMLEQLPEGPCGNAGPILKATDGDEPEKDDVKDGQTDECEGEEEEKLAEEEEEEDGEDDKDVD